jgi:hypothetical protein
VDSQRELTAKDLSNWKMIEHFQSALAPVVAKAQLHPTYSDPRRELGYASYLSLFLFGLFNPVVESMRTLCAISGLEKVQQQVGCRKVSLGSFSETQRVLDPDLLKQVFENLVEKTTFSPKADPRLMHLDLIAQDGSLWSALPRMAWAEYGVGCKGHANGVRLHLRFNILKDSPADALVTRGKGCETQALREMLLPGQTNVADRYYGKDYQLFGEIDQAKAFFVFRISQHAVIHTAPKTKTPAPFKPSAPSWSSDSKPPIPKAWNGRCVNSWPIRSAALPSVCGCWYPSTSDWVLGIYWAAGAPLRAHKWSLLWLCNWSMKPPSVSPASVRDAA